MSNFTRKKFFNDFGIFIDTLLSLKSFLNLWKIRKNNTFLNTSSKLACFYMSNSNRNWFFKWFFVYSYFNYLENLYELLRNMRNLTHFQIYRLELPTCIIVYDQFHIKLTIKCLFITRYSKKFSEFRKM